MQTMIDEHEKTWASKQTFIKVENFADKCAASLLNIILNLHFINIIVAFWEARHW